MSTNNSTTDRRTDTADDPGVEVNYYAERREPQAVEWAPVDRTDIPRDVRASIDVYRDYATDLGADELEVRHYGDGVFDVVIRHGGEDA